MFKMSGAFPDIKKSKEKQSSLPFFLLPEQALSTPPLPPSTDHTVQLLQLGSVDYMPAALQENDRSSGQDWDGGSMQMHRLSSYRAGYTTPPE